MSPNPSDSQPALVNATQAEAMADAVADALARFAVAYTHVTLADLSTAGRSWKVHEIGHGNPFEHNVWLGEFDNRADAHACCAKLRRDAAVDAARHRLASFAPVTSLPDLSGLTPSRDKVAEAVRIANELDNLSSSHRPLLDAAAASLRALALAQGKK